MFSGAPKSGAPFWVTGSFDAPPEYFDISARAPADTSIDQMRLMMQALLADRFHMLTHYVSADAPVFALVLAKPGVTGPDLQPHPPSDACAGRPTSSAPPPLGPRPRPARQSNTSRRSIGGSGASRPTARELDALGEVYHPYRSVAAWYCWRAAEIYGSAAVALPV